MTATTKNQRLDKFFKYSLVKRKKDALQGGKNATSANESNSAEADYSSNQDGSCYVDEESHGDSSSYNGEGAVSKRRKRRSKRKLNGRGAIKKISKRNQDKLSKFLILIYQIKL